MGKLREFCDLAEPVSTFERLFRTALETLLPELAACPWHVREREVVNLFVFRHLVPQFQKQELDISQIAIEIPVLKLPNPKTDDGNGERKHRREAVGKYADIIVWPHIKASRWVTCRPLVHIEWKNISCIEDDPRKLEQGHGRDKQFLKHNRELFDVSYAVLTDQRENQIELRCTWIQSGKEPEDFFRPECVTTLQSGMDAHRRVLSNGESVFCLRYIPNSPYLGKVLTYGELLSSAQGSACPKGTCKASTALMYTSRHDEEKSRISTG